MRITRADDKSLWPDLNLLELLERISSEGYIPTYEEKRALETRKELNLNGKEITTLPDSIKELKALEFLRLDRTKLVSLPESIGQLSKLKSLSLSRTDINSLPESIGQLAALMLLNISHTRVDSLPKSLERLTNLESLDLSYSKFTSIPEQLGRLPKLRQLELCGLTLPELPQSLSSKGLVFVEKAHLWWNDSGINLHNTTLTKQSKSIFLESPELIRGLYRDQITLRECKVIFLGDGETGKSYTIQRFKNGGKKETKDAPYITKETPGVEITNYSFVRGRKNFQIHFWDFGGQQLLHSMHRCFLTEETCYVVTVKSRVSPGDAIARYWLRNIEAFAPKSPVLLFVNCWDNDNGMRTINETALRAEFPQIADVVYCSAKEADEATFRACFMESLINMILKSGICARTVNRHWDAVRRTIIAKNANYLTKERYHKICFENGIQDDNASDLLTFFNNLGICFSYHRDAEKRDQMDYKLLNPVWLTNAIYAIIEEGMSYAQNGSIPIEAIRQMLGNEAPKNLWSKGNDVKKEYRRTRPDLIYSSKECKYVIDVACAFNLCYRVNRETVFFPALCQTNSPENALTPPEGYTHHVEYYLEYNNYLPNNVIHQLMIRCKTRDLNINSRWLSGMVLGAMGMHKATIRMEDDRYLYIDIWSKHDQTLYQIFSILRSELIQINENLHLNAKEYISHGKDAFSITSLIKAAKKDSCVFGDENDDLKATELLGKLFDEWTTKFIVETGRIIVPVIPREYHPMKKNNAALRFALFEAHKRICPYCGLPIRRLDEMEIDHILPSNYRNVPELDSYITYLNSRGFDTSNPDYIENYLPIHRHCNIRKSNFVDIFSFLSWHNLAELKTPRVLKLIKEYKATKP